MGKFARGKKSLAISDRGGLRVKYTDLKTTWDGLRVAPDDWEAKQPQLTPAKNVVDATALFNPRPDNDPENVDFFVGYNYDIFLDPRQRPPVGIHGLGSVASTGLFIEMEVSVTGVAGTGAVGTSFPNPAINPATGTGAIGSSSVVISFDINVTGVAGTGALGDLIFATPVTGLAGTGAIGSSTVEQDFDVSGVAGTGAIGTSTTEQEQPITGVAGTGAIGTSTPEQDLEISGVAGTGAVHVIGTGAGSDFNVIVDPVTGLGGVGATGTEVAESEITETGLAGTGAIGDGSVVQPAVGFGNNEWNNGSWGNG